MRPNGWRRVGRATSVHSPLDLYRGVTDPDLLRTHGLFVAEGRLIVRRVLGDPRYRVHSVLVNDAARRQLADALEGAPVIVASAEELAGVTGFHVHRGCLALVHRPEPMAPDELIARGGPLLVLDGVANADNVGGAFRNAAAFGASGVLLGPACCDPLYRKAIRTSMGAALRVPFAKADVWPGVMSAIKTRGFTVAALTPRERAEPIDRFAARVRGQAVAVVAGAEGEGISQEAEAFADARVRIPMAEGVDSLNVAIAVGIALYELSRR
jgi:tRNA G18 (ribose-2'-O)-methylase SpoU